MMEKANEIIEQIQSIVNEVGDGVWGDSTIFRTDVSKATMNIMAVLHGMVIGDFGPRFDCANAINVVLMELACKCQNADGMLKSHAGGLSEIDKKLLPELVSAIADKSYETHSKSSPEVRRAVLALTDGKCTYCDVELIDGGQASNSFVVEHVVPASKGGPDNLVNYVPACQSCNISKRDGHVLDFIKRRQGGNVTTLPTLPKREAAE